MFKINDIVRSMYNTKMANIWRVKDIEQGWNGRILVLELIYAPGTTRKRTIRCGECTCSPVTKEQVTDEIATLQKNITVLSNLNIK